MQATRRGSSFSSFDVSNSLAISHEPCDSGFESPLPSLGFTNPTTLPANNRKTEELEDDLQFEFTDEEFNPRKDHSDTDNEFEDDSLSLDEQVISTEISTRPKSKPIPVPKVKGRRRTSREKVSTPNSFTDLSSSERWKLVFTGSETEFFENLTKIRKLAREESKKAFLRKNFAKNDERKVYNFQNVKK